MQSELHKEVFNLLSKMSLYDITTFIIESEIYVKNLGIKSNNLKFYGNLERLKELINKDNRLRGIWKISNNNLFEQLLLKENNINFYKNGTILVQGNMNQINGIKMYLTHIIDLFNLNN